jgi:hypothetical protein
MHDGDRQGRAQRSDATRVRGEVEARKEGEHGRLIDREPTGTMGVEYCEATAWLIAALPAAPVRAVIGGPDYANLEMSRFVGPLAAMLHPVTFSGLRNIADSASPAR